MPKWTVPLTSELPASRVGRKAAALGRLIENGFPVPASVCITTEAFNIAVSIDPANLRLPDGLLEELAGAFPTDTPLAVRSSGVQEDMPEMSLAGRYSTYLNVNGPVALSEAVLDCWRSYFTAPAPVNEGGMAVLIRPMLESECAGVCFTIDPVRLRPDFLLVVSGWGQGAGVVSGSVPTDTARLRRTDLSVEDFSIADKHTALRPAAVGSGITPVPVLDELRAIPCLPESWLERVGQFGLAMEQVFGAPQDMEWTIANGQLWILQSRPITTLPAETCEAVRFPISWENEEEPHHYWWLERARDSAGAPLLPAELDFVRINTRGANDAVYYGGGADTRWRKYVNGRVYMAAAKSLNSPCYVRIYGAALQDMYARLAQQDVTIWEHWGPEVVRATGRLASFDPHGADSQGLADHLEDAVAAAKRHWMVHTLSPRPIRSPALLDVYARLTGHKPEEAAVDIPFLVAGAETVQTRLVKALYDLACLAMGAPEAARGIALAYPAGSSLDVNIQSFASAFSRLMAEYGDRLCYRPVPGYPVDLPQPWREAPEHVWEMIGSYLPLARQGGPAPHESRAAALRAADERVEGLCANAREPALVEEFRRRLAYARRSAASLDEQNHYIDQVSEGQYIQAVLYAGRWLAERGRLDRPFDVLWLTADEVLAALRESPAGLDTIIASRRAQYVEWQKLIAPANLGLPGNRLLERPVHPQRSGNLPVQKEDGHAARLMGEPASRGRAEGRARLISADALPVDVLPGDILVARNAGLFMIPILPAAAALVLDEGGPGDHFAITAREFGLPSVCATRFATRRIPEGAWVTVDALTGLVSWA